MTTRNYKSKFHFGDAELPYKYNSSVLRRSKNEKKCPDCGITIDPESNIGTSGCILCFDEGRYASSIHDDGKPHYLDQ